MNDIRTSTDPEVEIGRTTASLLRKVEGLEHQFERTKERVARVAHAVNVRAQVRERPWRSVGLAFAAGFVVGLVS